jgi:hypothetical protein
MFTKEVRENKRKINYIILVIYKNITFACFYIFCFVLSKVAYWLLIGNDLFLYFCKQRKIIENNGKKEL